MVVPTRLKLASLKLASVKLASVKLASVKLAGRLGETWSHRSARCLLLALGLAAGAWAIAGFDQAFSSAAQDLDVPGDLHKLVNLSEVFGHSSGAIAIIGTLLWVAADRRRVLWGAALLTLVSGLTANILKVSVVRIRPHSVEIFSGKEAGGSVAGAAASRAARPLSSPEHLKFWDSRLRSFPSGHAATAWGLGIGLALVFPRGLWLFGLFASLASYQRLVSGAHYPTDVLAGAAIAFLWAAVLLALAERRNFLSKLIADRAHEALLR